MTTKCLILDAPDPLAAAAYIAGVIDGDGSISISRQQTGRWPTFGVILRVDTTSRALADHLQRVTGLGSVMTLEVRDPVRHRPGYAWAVTGAAAASILYAVSPFLRMKAPRAAPALALAAAQRGRGARSRAERAWQAELHARMAVLNGTGQVALPGFRLGVLPRGPHGWAVRRGRNRVVRMLSTTDRAYLAGLLDSEGRITVKTTSARSTCRYRVLVDVGHTDPHSLSWLWCTSGAGTIRPLGKPRKDGPAPGSGESGPTMPRPSCDRCSPTCGSSAHRPNWRSHSAASSGHRVRPETGARKRSGSGRTAWPPSSGGSTAGARSPRLATATVPPPD
jgi:hypothetical protein